MLLSLLFLTQQQDMQFPNANTGGQCVATEPAAAQQKQTTMLGGESGLKTTEKSDVSDKQMYNAKAARGTIWNHNRGMQDRGCKMNDELLYREFKSLSLVQEDCF